MDIKKYKKEQENKSEHEKGEQMRTAFSEVAKKHVKTAHMIGGLRAKRDIEKRSGEGRHAIIRSMAKNMAKKLK